MFSGLTNQVTSWIGAAKGEPQDEEVPPLPPVNQVPAQPEPVQEPIEQPVAEGEEEGDKKQSPTKAGGMFSNVKSQMSGWLGNATIPSMPAMPAMPAMPSMPAMPAMPSIPSIPGLRKTGAENELGAEGVQQTDPALVDETNQSGPGVIEEDDKSRYISATEGADSRPASGAGTPTDEQAGQIGNVTTKVTQGAKTFGSFLYSAVNKAGAKIKETVKDNTILGEFNKEQEAFIKGQQNKADPSVAPWIGHTNEAKIKEEILSLSQDRRNFVRAPPAGVDFQFDYDVSYPVALAIMAEDAALEKMRFELVPKIITEENFWKNYFYRVSLICQAGDLGTLGTDGSIMGQQSSEEVKTVNSETNSNSTEPLKRNWDQKTSLAGPKAKADADESKPKSLSESEFVSDTFQTTETDLEEVKAGMRKLGIDTLAQQAIDNEEQWEKDLEAELQEYEVVNDGTSGGGGSTSTNIRTRSSPSNNDWEQYADLIDETDDLK